MESWMVAAISVGSSAMAWLLGDTRYKSKLGFMEEKIGAIKDAHDSATQNGQDRLSSLEIRLAKSDQERTEIHRMIERMDNTKASKEVVDGFRTEISGLKIDMDKRFDRIERLIERSNENKGYQQ